MSLLSTHSWQDISLNDVASTAKLSLPELRGITTGKQALLEQFVMRIDDQMLAGAQFEGVESTMRDRLAETLLVRLEALAPHREAIRSLREATRSDPGLALYLSKLTSCSMRWATTASGISITGLRGMLFHKALVVIYIKIIGTWIKDDTADMSLTMTELDRLLNRAEKTWRTFFQRGRQTHEAEPAA